MSWEIREGDVLERLREMPDESIQCVVTEAQAAYLSGLIDGDGSLECQREMQKGARTPGFRVRLSFGMATREPLETIAGWLGIDDRLKVYRPRQPNRQPIWRLHVPKGITMDLLRVCLPHLILKRRQAEILLEIEEIRLSNSPSRQHIGAPKFLPMPAEAVWEMDKLHMRLRSLKSNKRPQ